MRSDRMYAHKNGKMFDLYKNNKSLFSYPKGELAVMMYNALNEKGLWVTDEDGSVCPGYYRGTDAGSGMTRNWKITDNEYIWKVCKDTFARVIIETFNPRADTLKQMFLKIRDIFESECRKDDNALMYTKDFINGEWIERRYDYGDGENIQIEDLQALVGYDLQFLNNYRLCKRCKKLYKPEGDMEFCSDSCRCEFSRRKSPWNDAKIRVKKQIDDQINTITAQIQYMPKNQLEEKELLEQSLDTCNSIYNEWLDLVKGGYESKAAKLYESEGKMCSYTEFLQDLWQEMYLKHKNVI